MGAGRKASWRRDNISVPQECLLRKGRGPICFTQLLAQVLMYIVRCSINVGDRKKGRKERRNKRTERKKER